MIDRIFEWCVNVLVYWAGVLGITYKAINVWVFVIIWPILTVVLIASAAKNSEAFEEGLMPFIITLCTFYNRKYYNDGR